MEQTTQLFLIPAEAQQFMLFQAHYEPITVLLDADVFSIRNGSATLHFDHTGTLQTIQRSDYLYSRKHA
jgi:hypothetical protein